MPREEENYFKSGKKSLKHAECSACPMTSKPGDNSERLEHKMRNNTHITVTEVAS
jgi:hypothetical protein